MNKEDMKNVHSQKEERQQQVKNPLQVTKNR